MAAAAEKGYSILLKNEKIADITLDAAALKSLAQQADDDSGQQIAAAANGHSRVAGGVYVLPLTVGDAAFMALEHHHTVQLPGGLHGGFHPTSADGIAQPGKFAAVGREDGGGSSSAQYMPMPGNQVYAVRVQNHRAAGLFQKPEHHFSGALGLPQAAADQHRVHRRKPLFDFFHSRLMQHAVPVGQGKYNGLVQFHRFDGINALRHPQKYQPRPGAQGTHGGQIGRTGIAPAAAEQQYFAEISFVGGFLPVRQQGKNRFVAQNHG